MNTIYRIRWGAGRPGKLWTGDAPAEGALVWNPQRIQRVCGNLRPSGVDPSVQFQCSSTVQFRCSLLEIADAYVRRQVEQAATDLWLFAGGVESLQEDLPLRLALSNWSHRIGGCAIVAPAAVATTKLVEEPPIAPEGWEWAQVYRGETLRQWVLIPAGEEQQTAWVQSQIEAVPFREPLKSELGYERCPPCRERNQAITPESVMEVRCLENSLQ